MRSDPNDRTGGGVVHVYEADDGQFPCFGELSLIYGKPRAASVIAMQPGVLWALDRRVFQRVVVRAAYTRKEIFKTLRGVELFKCLSVPQLQRFADLLTEESFASGDYIIKQGDVGDTFYILVSGTCNCTVGLLNTRFH